MPPAQSASWETLTSLQDVRRMRVLGDTLFVLTSGGMLAITDRTQAGMSLTNVDGLGTSDLTDMIVDSRGQRWITGFGRLVAFGEAPVQFPFADNDGQSFGLRCVRADGDALWVGTSRGLVLFSTINDGGQIEDSYQLFGDLNPQPDVNDILLTPDSIWLATSDGLAVAQRSVPNLLKAPQSWTVFSRRNHPELASDSITRVIRFESSIYVGTPVGLYRLAVDSLVPDTSFVPVFTLSGAGINDLVVEDDSLILYSNRGTARVRNEQVLFPSIPDMFSAVRTGASFQSTRWIALRAGGLQYDTGGAFITYPFTGAPGNDVTDVAVQSDGNIIAGFLFDPFAQYDGVTWSKFAIGSIGWSTDMILGSSEAVWGGTWGRGLFRFGPDSVERYDSFNSAMRGNNDDPPISYNFIVIRGLASDGDYMYIGCYRSYTGYPIVIADINRLDQPDGWDSVGVADGITSDRVVSLDVHNGRLAMGTEAAGIFLCDLGADPFTRPRPACIQQTSANSRLLSDDVNIVRFDPDGVLWAGTSFGISRWNPGTDRYDTIPHPAQLGAEVTDLEFDGRGNLWVATRGGIARRDAATGDFDAFTQRDGLVSNNVRRVALDRFTGDLLAATDAGISILRSSSAPRVSNLDNVIAFPNPFVPSIDGRLQFNFERTASVSFFSVAGELVRELPSIDLGWGGRNEAGEQVASGVYLFVLTDKDGRTAGGKILLVRR